MSWEDLLQEEANGNIVITGLGPGASGSLARGPRPGDVVQFRDKTGQGFETRLGSDGTLADPVPSTKQPAPKISTNDYPSASDVAPDAPAAVQQHYEAVRNDPNVTPADMNTALSVLMSAEKAAQATKAASDKTDAANAKADATTQAQAQSAAEKLAIGKTPTATELAAYNKLLMTGQSGTQGPMSDIQRYANEVTRLMGPTAGAFALAQARLETGNGTQMSTRYNFGNVGNTDSNPTGGPSYSSPEEAAQDWVRFVTNNGRSGPGMNRYAQFLADVHAGADIGTLAQDMQAAGYATDPQYAAKIAAIAKTPLPTGLTSSNAANPLAGLGTTPKYTSADVKNFGTADNPQWFQLDPASGKWSSVDLPGNPTLTALPRTMASLQAFQTTSAYLKQQVANGTYTVDQANQYQQANWQNYQAQLQGTTPFELQKMQQEVEQQQAARAQSLIDKQLSASQQMTDAVLSQVDKMKSFNGWAPGLDPFGYARSLAQRQLSDATGGTDIGSLVRSLLQASNVPVPLGGNVPAMPSAFNITAPTPGAAPAPAGAPLGAVAPTGPGTPGITAGLNQPAPDAGMAPNDPALLQAQSLMTGIGS